MQHRELLSQHVEIVVARGALQAAGSIEAQLALFAAFERLIDTKHRVGAAPLVVDGVGVVNARGIHRERCIRPRAGDHALRVRRFHPAARRLQLAVIAHEQRFGLRQREIARRRLRGRKRQEHSRDNGELGHRCVSHPRGRAF